MTQTMTESVPDSSLRPPRLERPHDAPFRGVCTAIAEVTGTDAVLWRVLTVVLTFFGGLGIVLYVLGIVAIAREDEERSVGDRLLHGPDRHLRGGQLLAVVILVVGLAGLITGSSGTLVLLVLGGLGVLWWRRRDQRPPSTTTAGGPAEQTGPVQTGPVQTGPVQTGPVQTGQVQTGMASAWTPPPPRPERPRRPRSPLGGITASIAALVAGVLVLIGATTDTSIPPEVILGSALAVVGLGLIVGSRWGRSVGLVLLALVLAIALAVTAAVRPVLDAGLGDRTWTPTGSATYRLGVGEATLDLAGLATRAEGSTSINARVDVGHLIVLVPADLGVRGTASADAGEILVGTSERNGRDARYDFVLGPADGPQVQLTLRVRLGQVEVRRA